MISRHPSGRAVVIHSIGQARAALAAADAAGVPVTLMSGGDSTAYLGPLWFREVLEITTREYPAVAVDSVLDCGDCPGQALAALRAGLVQVRFTGGRTAAARLSQIAEAQGARLLTRRIKALDLLDHPSPERACRDWLAGGPGR